MSFIIRLYVKNSCSYKKSDRNIVVKVEVHIGKQFPCCGFMGFYMCSRSMKGIVINI